MSLAVPFAEQAKLQFERLILKLRVVCTTAGDSGIKGYCLNAGGVEVYSDTDGQTIASALGFTTTELDDDAAAGIIGVHVPVTDASQLVDVRLCRDSFADAAILSSGSTAGTLASITVAPYGASATGVTASGGLAFTLTLTSIDLDSAIGNHDFWIEVIYSKTAVA